MQVEVEMGTRSHSLSAELPSTDDHPEAETRDKALQEENRQLRELVIYLSKLVLRNVMDQGRPPP
jgi:hypothetical protein